MEDEIKLTPQELEEIKDTITFRVKIAKDIKHLMKKVDDLKKLPEKVSVLATKVSVQWWLITFIFIAIAGFGLRAILKQ